MPAQRYNLIIEQGATFRRSFAIKENGVAVDLSGHTARMQIRETVSSSTTLLEASTSNGRITITGATGTVLVQISATDTAALTFARGVYDLLVTRTSDGYVTRHVQGDVRLDLGVTR
jgi:hypothetical protein